MRETAAYYIKHHPHRIDVMGSLAVSCNKILCKCQPWSIPIIIVVVVVVVYVTKVSWTECISPSKCPGHKCYRRGGLNKVIFFAN